MSQPNTCPYCNALLSATGWCPRCDETAGDDATTPTRQSSRRRQIAVVVGICLVAGGIWLVVAGRHHINRFLSPTPAPEPATARPAEMPGLGYLPESTEAILAIQVPLLLERVGPAAKDNPAKALTALGLPASVAEMLDKASAVGLKNVDQLVVGLSFEGHSLPPLMVIVVHARQPFDLAAIASRMKAHEQKQRDGRTLYSAKASPLPEIYWWQATDRVLVATILAKDFDTVRAVPRSGIDHLRPALAGLIRDQVAADSCAWFAASSDKWDPYLKPYTFLPGTPLSGRTDLLKPAERLRTVAISIPHDPEHRVDVRIGEKSAEAGAELRGMLTERLRDEAIDVSGEGEVCQFQMENDAKRIASLMGKLVADGK
jgi:hypothetical protein